MAKILIVGCGYVGIELARNLSKRGHQCFGLRRDCSSLPEEVEAISFDLSRPDLLLELPTDINCVFFMLAAQGRSEKDYLTAYVSCQRRLLEALVPPVRYFYISSTGVYGQNDGSWVDETSSTAPKDARQKILLEGEQLALSSKHEVTVVRFGGIYGPDRMGYIQKLLEPNGSPLKLELRMTNRIHLHDCVGALTFLLEQESLPEIVNVVDDCPASTSEIQSWCLKSQGKDVVEKQICLDDLEKSGKQVNNSLIRTLGYKFKHPDYRSGYLGLI